jgi:putative hydrolase of the HAD superfamily
MNEIDPRRVQAVVFDLGGVFLEGGPNHVRSFGPRNGMPAPAWDAIRDALFVSGDWWDRVERDELTLDAFAAELQARVAAEGVTLTLDQARNFMAPPAVEGETALTGEGVMESHLRTEIVDACRHIRAVMPTALLTNNIREWRQRWRDRIEPDTLFDVVVDSSDVGMRKPEPHIYRLMEQRLGLPGTSLLFVDDLGTNLKAAKALGWQTVKYEDTAAVLDVLQRVTAGRPPRAR